MRALRSTIERSLGPALRPQRLAIAELDNIAIGVFQRTQIANRRWQLLRLPIQASGLAGIGGNRVDIFALLNPKPVMGHVAILAYLPLTARDEHKNEVRFPTFLRQPGNSPFIALAVPPHHLQTAKSLVESN